MIRIPAITVGVFKTFASVIGTQPRDLLRPARQHFNSKTRQCFHSPRTSCNRGLETAIKYKRESCIEKRMHEHLQHATDSRPYMKQGNENLTNQLILPVAPPLIASILTKMTTFGLFIERNSWMSNLCTSQSASLTCYCYSKNMNINEAGWVHGTLGRVIFQTMSNHNNKCRKLTALSTPLATYWRFRNVILLFSRLAYISSRVPYIQSRDSVRQLKPVLHLP